MRTTTYYIKIGFLTLIMSLVVNFAKAQCTANFNDTSSICGVVQFTNLSTGTSSTTNYFWNFGNSSPTSSLQSPSGTYTANGTYTVCLFISSLPTCSSNICKTITVNCFSTTCTANFSSSTCVGAGQMTYFNTSPGTNSTTVYNWDLGNSATSTLTNPTGTYSANGIYTVCLSYTTTAPAYCTATICKTVSINCASVSCNANFTASPCDTTGQISFSSTSTGTTGTMVYNWNFGNSTTSTLQNPTATYTANGVYTVCLTFTNTTTTCSATICKTVTMNCLPTPTCQANFTNTPCTNGQTTFYSISTGTNATTSYSWTNSAPPSQPNPPVAYTVTVCLKMVNSSPTCSSSICKTVLIDCAGIGFEEFSVEGSNIKIFPNPGNGLFNLDVSQINLNSSSFNIKVYNILGELVHQNIEEVHSNKLNIEIDLQSLPNGPYYLRLIAGNKAYSVKLIIVK